MVKDRSLTCTRDTRECAHEILANEDTLGAKPNVGGLVVAARQAQNLLFLRSPHPPLCGFVRPFAERGSVLILHDASTGLPHIEGNALPQDPTVGLCLGS